MGGAISHNNKNKKFANLLSTVSELEPDILFIQIGSNDLSRHHVDFDRLISSIISFCNYALNLGTTTCVIGTQWDRSNVDDFTEKKAIFNAKLKSRCKVLKNIFFKDHQKLKNPRHGISRYLEKDGVHLNNKGNKVLYRSLRGSIIFTGNKIDAL